MWSSKVQTIKLTPHFANDVGKSLMMNVEQICFLFWSYDPTFILFKHKTKTTYHTKWAKQSYNSILNYYEC